MRSHLAGLVLAFAGGEALAVNPAPPPPLAGHQMTDGPEHIFTAGSEAGFEHWLDGFRARARAHGISAAVIRAAFAHVAYDPAVIEKDRNQGEFVKPIWEYLDRAVSDERVANGRAALKRHARLLERIEATYGVDKEVVVAVWGLESSYGENRGNLPLVQSLATLAYDGRRGAFFEQQLIAALKIIQAGNVRPEDMTGSWAGAMGHTQFIPTSYLAFAVDFTGDGRRDIWSDDPADALASTASYLARSGWKVGRRWGVEVQLPANFDLGLAGHGHHKSAADWAALGVRGMDGRPVAEPGPASILLPAGARGAAFMIFPNFRAIEKYNAADAYVIAVGHLSDRLKGGGPIVAGWPRDDRALYLAERRELQERLTAAGFDTGGADGRIGPRTIAAIRAFQRSIGERPDGYASLDILKRLRG
ncbi:MAG: lytic murein transglycosylase [Proteobacteria bacterium]|nr:lytic murein transglycosylase [Pseudomonadota bacterium]MBS0573998.1 lytic murein transglycosylase [Pseudomonadota bacterium]